MRRRLALIALAFPIVVRGGSVELSQGADAISGDRPGWRATALDAVWTGERRGLAAGGGVRTVSRFEEDDVELSAFGQAPAGGFVLGLEGSTSPTGNFLPRWSTGGRVEREVTEGWVASLGGRVARYRLDAGTSTPVFGSAGLERYWGRWRAAAAATAVTLEGQWGGGGRAALDLFYGEGGRAGVALAAGREVESLGGGRLLWTDTLGAALVGAHPLRGGWALTWELSASRQGDLYSRLGGRLGLRRHF